MPGPDHPSQRHGDVPVSIRRAQRNDLPALVKMIDGLARHHGDRATVTEAELATLLFATRPWAVALIAEVAGAAVGYAVFYRLVVVQYGARGADLHHLFVMPNVRRHGVGRRLIDAVAAEAAALGCRYLAVSTAPDNVRAQALYERLGFEYVAPFGRRYRRTLDADAASA